MGRQGGPPHHISSIAHLFFGEQTSEQYPVSADTEAFVAVVSLDDGQLAAYTAAGLAVVAGYSVTRAARDKGRSPEGRWPRDGARATLREAPDERWSARSFLADRNLAEAEPGSSGLPAPFVSYRPVSSLLGRILEMPRPDGSAAASAGERMPGLHVINCGSATARAGIIEACRKPVVGHDPAAPELTGLVAILTEDQAAGWQAVLRLGQLASCLQPAAMDILVFPADWRGSTAGRTRVDAGAHTKSPAIDLLQRRCRGLLAAAVPEPDWRVTGVAYTGSGPGPERAGAWLIDIVARLF